jgi:hypothetical protein
VHSFPTFSESRTTSGQLKLPMPRVRRRVTYSCITGEDDHLDFLDSKINVSNFFIER